MLRVVQHKSNECFSYVVFDDQTKETIIIDPTKLTLRSIENTLSKSRLQIKYLVDTHTHDDHTSATLVLKNSCGGSIALSECTSSKTADLHLKNGDLLALGSFLIKVLFVPGHANDHIALATDDFVFTGDTLHIGATARPDFTEIGVESLFFSIKEKIFALEDRTLVFPGHDYGSYLFSSIGIEKTINKEIATQNLDSYVELKKTQISHSSSSSKNKSLENRLFESDAFYIWEMMSMKKIKLIDLRERDKYSQESFPNSYNIPLSELGMELPSFDKKQLHFLASETDAGTREAQRTLELFGIRTLSVSGGMTAWKKCGLPINTRIPLQVVTVAP